MNNYDIRIPKHMLKIKHTSERERQMDPHTPLSLAWIANLSFGDLTRHTGLVVDTDFTPIEDKGSQRGLPAAGGVDELGGEVSYSGEKWHLEC